MIKDRKGEAGFMEAIIAVMVVSIALTSFLGLLAYSQTGQSVDCFDLNTDFADHLSIENGEIIGDYEKPLNSFMERNDLNGIRFRMDIVGPASDASIDFHIGKKEGLNAQSVNGTASVNSDDGRTYVASYEVIYWWD